MKFQSVLVALGTVFLASCGGGGGGGASSTPPPVTNPPPPDSGIDRGGVAQGVITGFGSIFVNGIRFDTSSASFTIDDNPGSESDLDVGKVVTVTGSIDDDGQNGTADDVIFDDEVEGPIDSIDIAAATLVVLGQLVIVDAGTLFDDSIVPNALDGLSVGQVVEVSGFVGADGSITATYIELTNDTEFEITGTVSALDTGAMTFEINGQVIDYSGATLEDFPAGQIEDGMRVEAEGTTIGSNGELAATRVEFEDDDLPGEEDDDVEIEGFITRFTSATDFDVSGHAVTTTGSTIFENGTAADLAEGVKVEVEGNFDSNGVLVAEKVSLRQNADIELEAMVDSTDVNGGTLTVLGLVIATTDVTRFEDDSDQSQSTFGLGDISSGNWVEVKAYLDESGNLIATQVERDDAEDEVEIKAAVEAVARPDLQVLGLTIQTDANTEYEDINELPLSADDFFAQVDVATRVQIRGAVLSGNVILASEIELEEEDD
ncbi:MAG: DUF5666 domain-containing protein [Gammaproteobacteria bacterium]|nr:DUF5666 domain-containing protein [Gammaproteobacteria bacterium]